jgi:hypothetical protein
MSHLNIPASAFREELDSVKTERQRLKALDAELGRKQSWLEQGIEYVGGNDPPPAESIQELVPPEVVFREGRTKPTIRQAVVLAMKAQPPERLWKPADVIEDLEQRGWLPEAKSAHQMIRNRMLAMLERGELVRRDPGGFYQLAPDIRNTGLLMDDPEDR